MTYNLQKLFFTVAIAVSFSISTLPSYAKDDADTKPKTSKVEKKPKKEKEAKSRSSKKNTEADNKRSNKSGKNSNDKTTKDTSKGSRSNTENTAKDSKKKGAEEKAGEKSTNKGNTETSTKDTDKNSGKTLKTTEQSNVKKRTPANNTAKKQFKNIIVNINKADAKTFSHYLMGIGPVKAKAIIAYRSKNGKFKDIKELLKIEGIGEKVFAGLNKNISLSKGEESAPKAGQSSTKKAK